MTQSPGPSSAIQTLSRRRHSPEPLNIMVAGKRGVGKSTLLQTLCDQFPRFRLQSLKEGEKSLYTSTNNGPAAEEVLDPFCIFDTLSGTTAARNCQALVRDYEHTGDVLLELIDTPGIDPEDETRATEQVDEMCREIERRLENTVEEEMQVRREKGWRRRRHVHLVLYVVPPPAYSSRETDSPCHRMDVAIDILSSIDAEAIKRLGRYTNVILAIGKCDTLEDADKKMLRSPDFFAQVNDLLAPTKLFVFRDAPGMRRDPEEEQDVRKYSKKIIRQYPFLLCGSKHVDEWQQMRLPEYQSMTTSISRVSVADWRVLATNHNKICSSTTMITDGIFRARHGSSKESDRRKHSTAFDNLAESMHSLALRSDSVVVKRLDQRREIHLVRQFGWGTLQLNNPDHCSFALLVDVLFHSFRRALVHWTDMVHYEQFRLLYMASNPRYSSVGGKVSGYVEAELAQKRRSTRIEKHGRVLPEDHGKYSTAGPRLQGNPRNIEPIGSSNGFSGSRSLNHRPANLILDNTKDTRKEFSFQCPLVPLSEPLVPPPRNEQVVQTMRMPRLPDSPSTAISFMPVSDKSNGQVPKETMPHGHTARSSNRVSAATTITSLFTPMVKKLSGITTMDSVPPSVQATHAKQIRRYTLADREEAALV